MNERNGPRRPCLSGFRTSERAIPDAPTNASCSAQAVVFARPTAESVAAIRRLLRAQRFGEYYLCTCNRLAFGWNLAVSLLPLHPSFYFQKPLSLFSARHPRASRKTHHPRQCFFPLRRRISHPLRPAPVFSNVLRDSYLHELADADEHEAIRQVQEHYVRDLS